MSRAACVTRCQPSLMARSLCVCGHCRGRLHGICARQRELWRRPVEAEAEQLGLALVRKGAK